MSGGILHYQIDRPGMIRDAIKATLRAGKPVLLTHRSWLLLIRESGGRQERALQFLMKQGGKANIPVLLNLEFDDGTSKTISLARGWTEERLAGYMAGLHQELEAEFGEVERVYSLNERAAS